VVVLRRLSRASIRITLGPDVLGPDGPWKNKTKTFLDKLLATIFDSLSVTTLGKMFKT
jgi:hypothetical protein